MLEGLGPVFGAFAAYMGSRIDLLPASDCRQLARAERTGRATPPHEVRALVAAELARADGWDLAIDAVPFAVTTVSQVHRGFLPDDSVVHVHLHTASFTESGDDLESIPLAEGLFDDRIPPSALRSAIADFRTRFQQDADFLARTALLEEGAREMRRGARLVLPLVFPELCSRRMLVTEILDDEQNEREEDGQAAKPRESSVVRAWLRQALFGSVCPLLGPVDRLASCGDRLVAPAMVRLPPRTQQRLLGYLFAVTGESPDRAWAALEPELTAAKDAAPAGHVVGEYRRLVPFRDDRSTDTGSAVADHVFLQWRVASRHGWLPSVQLVPFYRALFGILSAVSDAANDEDVLLEAIHSLRVQSDLRQLGGCMAESDVVSAIERQMALLIDLPQKLDRLLTVAADGGVRVQLVTDGASAVQRNRAATAVALLLIAAALFVLAGELPAVRELWASEAGRSAALVVTGAVLVWTVGRLR
jgi:hypothetical protein